MAKEREKKLFVGLLGNYAAELKLLLTTLLLLCAVATLLQFIPSRFTISASDLRVCISRVSQGPPPSSSLSHLSKLLSVAPSPSPIPSPPSPPSSTVEQDQILENGIIKRTFNTYGSAAYSFIAMSAYRGGLNTFAIVGLSSKPLHVFGNPIYECEWAPLPGTIQSAKPISAAGYKSL